MPRCFVHLTRSMVAAVLFASTGAIGVLAAQDRQPARDRAMRTNQLDRADSARRDSLEGRVRERMGQMLKTQLGLSDDQVGRLQATNRQFEGRRRALLVQERDSRMQLRQELQRGDSTRHPQVAVLLDRLMQVQRERLDMIEAEQKELATFLTPVQRARLFGMEEQIRQRMADMRDRRPAPRRPPAGRP